MANFCNTCLCTEQGGAVIRGAENGSLPYSLWITLKKKVSGWNLSTRFDTASKRLENIAYDIQAASGRTGMKLQLKGKADIDSQQASVSSINFVQSLKGIGPGTITVSPTYYVDSKATDVSVSYGVDDTFIVVDGNIKMQKVTIQQRIGRNNYIAPTISSDGKYELVCGRDVFAGTASIQLKPNAHVNVKYEDNAWVANMYAPISSSKSTKGLFLGKFDPNAVQLTLRRSIS